MARASEEYTIDKQGLHSIGTCSLLTCTYEDEKVIHFSCGWDHSAIVTESGRAYTFGANDFGKLGHGHARESISEPALVEALTSYDIVQSACGNEFTLFLTRDGKLFGCGHNGNGQIGLGNKTHSWLPLRIPDVPPLKKIAAGWGHSVALTPNGDLWVCGWNSQGQLGIHQTRYQTSFIQVRDVPAPIDDISCGERHTAILSESQDILVAGRGREGQLGLGNYEDACSFKALSLPSKVLSMACGSSHTVALTSDYRVWTWGYNKNGQLGVGDKTVRVEPSMLVGQNDTNVDQEDQNIVQVFAGKHHTAILTDRGEVMMCGRGASGELGQGVIDRTVPTPVKIEPGLKFVHLEFAWGYTLMLIENQIRILDE